MWRKTLGTLVVESGSAGWKKRKLKEIVKRELLLYHLKMWRQKMRIEVDPQTEQCGRNVKCAKILHEAVCAMCRCSSILKIHAAKQQALPVPISEVLNAAFHMANRIDSKKDSMNIQSVKARNFEKISPMGSVGTWPKTLIRSSQQLDRVGNLSAVQKDDKEVLKKLSPSFLLSHNHILFKRVITNRFTRLIDEHQPKE